MNGWDIYNANKTNTKTKPPKKSFGGRKLDKYDTPPPNYTYFEKQYGHMFHVDVLVSFKNNTLCMQPTHTITKCNAHLGLVVIISIIGSANRSPHI